MAKTSAAIYRSRDSISNFKIRVKLEKINSNSTIPTLPRVRCENELNILLNRKDRNPRAIDEETFDEENSGDYDEMTIGWQQKIFNRKEFHFYGTQIAPDADLLERKYYEDIRQMKQERRRPGRIFTSLDTDRDFSQQSLDHFLTDSIDEEPSRLALAIETFRRNNQSKSRSVRLSRDEVIIKRPTDDQLHVSHFATGTPRTMYIMADLSDQITSATAQLVVLPQPIEQHVLCKIQYYSDGCLQIEPDFNQHRTPYLIETGNYYNEVYQYYLEHASAPIQTTDLLLEKRILDEILSHQQSLFKPLVGNEFITPKNDYLKLYLFGEIVSASNFEYDEIYTYYCVDLSDGWVCSPSAQLSGYTTTGSVTRSSEYDDLVYFSYPFEFELFFKLAAGANEESFLKMPRIYFQVASHDSWGRHRTEGYTYIDIPTYPGFYDENLSCWRPSSKSLITDLRRFFIGSSEELEDLSYIAVPRSFTQERSQKPFSRFGFRTISTGSLNIRYHVVFQSHAIKLQSSNHPGKSVFKRDGFNALLASVDYAIEQFESAKKRALEMRSNQVQFINPDSSYF